VTGHAASGGWTVGRTLALGLGLAVAAWLVWQGTWLAVLMVGPLIWLALMAPRAEPKNAPRLLSVLLPLWSGQLETLQAQLQQGLEGLLASFTKIVELRAAFDAELARNEGADLGQLARLSQEVSNECDLILHSLQFGDRVHQMVDVVKNDQRQLESRLGTLWMLDDKDVEVWLSSLRTSYTTDEQHQTHRGEAVDAGRNSIDYF